MSRFWSILDKAISAVIAAVLVFIGWSYLHRPERPKQVQPASGSVEGSLFTHAIGSGPVVVLEFTDFQCPYCARFSQDTWPAVLQTLVGTRRITFVPVDFPLMAHPFAVPAAQVARCAGDQGQYWTAAPLLYRSLADGTFSPEGIGKQLRVDAAAYLDCLETKSDLQAGLAAGKRLGVTGTPTFFIGRRTAAGADLVTRIAGAATLEALTQAVTQAQAAFGSD